jgi:hypothetical protein
MDAAHVPATTSRGPRTMTYDLLTAFVIGGTLGALHRAILGL